MSASNLLVRSCCSLFRNPIVGLPTRLLVWVRWPGAGGIDPASGESLWLRVVPRVVDPLVSLTWIHLVSQVRAPTSGGDTDVGLFCRVNVCAVLEYMPRDAPAVPTLVWGSFKRLTHGSPSLFVA